MRYWDSSALVSLVVAEETSSAREDLLESDPAIATWWLSRIECASALNRLARDGALAESELELALEDLESLSGSWVEVQPTERIRVRALRLLRVHPLRAADSMQLAAALMLADEDPKAFPLVCSDDRLSNAARREGFRVV